jgi:hypothetical protein
MDNSTRTGKIVHAGDAYFRCHELKENGKLDMEKTMSNLNKTRILENDEQKKTNPNSNASFELGFVDSLKFPLCGNFYFCSSELTLGSCFWWCQYFQQFQP